MVSVRLFLLTFLEFGISTEFHEETLDKLFEKGAGGRKKRKQPITDEFGDELEEVKNTIAKEVKETKSSGKKEKQWEKAEFRQFCLVLLESVTKKKEIQEERMLKLMKSQLKMQEAYIKALKRMS